MRVHDLMASKPEFCRPDSNLADAAMVMWRRDCGFVPVVEDPGGKLVGVITDRDICIATAMKHKEPQSIHVGEVMSRRLHTCAPTDDIRTAVQTMKERQVRRLPVTDERGALKGVLSLNDVVLATGKSKASGALGQAEMMDVLQRISTHRSHAAVPIVA
ncbi:MAG: CBS domain-containing protein [Candidatus Eiseniibacteriota bacterium]